MFTSGHQIDPRLVSLTQPASLEAEQYQTLRLNLQRLKTARDIRMIAMTSPTSGDGKTLTAINLAGALARGSDTRVLLIEADLRRPTLAKQLGIPGSAIGLADIVLNPVLTLEDAVRRLDFGFSVITAGSSAAAVHEVFNSPRFKAVLERGARAVRLRDPRHAAHRPGLRLPSARAVGRRPAARRLVPQDPAQARSRNR